MPRVPLSTPATAPSRTLSMRRVSLSMPLTLALGDAWLLLSSQRLRKPSLAPAAVAVPAAFRLPAVDVLRDPQVAALGDPRRRRRLEQVLAPGHRAGRGVPEQSASVPDLRFDEEDS